MLNYSIRPVLWTHKANAKGDCPLKICITIDRKRAYKKTPYRLKEYQFRDGLVVGIHNAAIINAFINREKQAIEEQMYARTAANEVITINDFQNDKRGILLEEYAKIIRYDKTRVARILKYQPGLRMTGIDLNFLRAFEQHERKRKSHPNTIHSTFKYLSQLLAAAEREGIIEKNPMKLFKKPKYTKPEKDYLSDKEIKKLWKLLDKPLEENTRGTLVYFLLACYTGLRHSDWATFNPRTMYKDNLLRLRAYKNKMDVVIPVGPSLKKLIALTGQVPPALSNQKCNVHLKAISIMAELGKKITCHTARHTAGNLFASNGLNISIVAQLLAISENTAKVYFHLSGADITAQAAVLRTI